MENRLAEYRTYAGPCPWDEESGWMIALNFGDVQVTILDNSFTEGVELTVWGLASMPRTLTQVTPDIARTMLNALLDWLEAKKEVNCEQ